MAKLPRGFRSAPVFGPKKMVAWFAGLMVCVGGDREMCRVVTQSLSG